MVISKWTYVEQSGKKKKKKTGKESRKQSFDQVRAVYATMIMYDNTAFILLLLRGFDFESPSGQCPPNYSNRVYKKNRRFRNFPTKLSEIELRQKVDTRKEK